MSMMRQGLIELEPGDVARMVGTGEAVLIDVREEEEWAEERIDGAILLPMSDLDPMAWPRYPGRKTIIMCLGGVRSAAVGRRLLALGHASAIHLKGGLQAWKEAGLAIAA